MDTFRFPSPPVALRWVAVSLALASSLPLAHSTPVATPTTAATRFATDAAVRDGMLAIRATMTPQESAIATNQLDAASYVALAQRIAATLQGPIAQRSLPKAAAIAFRGSVWQDLEYCVGLMRDGRSVSMQRTGAFGVQQVLRNYPVYFDHPGW